MTGGSSFLATTSPNGPYQSILGANAVFKMFTPPYSHWLGIRKSLSYWLCNGMDAVQGTACCNNNIVWFGTNRDKYHVKDECNTVVLELDIYGRIAGYR